MKRSLAFWWSSVAMACTPSGPTPTPAGGSATMPEPVAPVAEPAAEPVVEPSPGAGEVQPELVIGVDRPARISKAARKASREGLRLHGAHDYEGARAAFAEAIAAQPEHDLARFNLACALSRLGRHADASAELIEVLTRDPVRFRGRARDDADLEPLRGSPEWKAVKAHLARVAVALDRVVANGVPSMFFDHTRPEAGIGVPQRGGTKDLVLGSYLHESARFVAFSHGGVAGYVDTARRRVVRIDSTIWAGASHSMWRSSKISVRSFEPGNDFVAVADLDTDGPPALGKPDLMNSGDNTGFEISMILVPSDEGAWLDLEWHTHADPYSKRSKLELTPTGLRRTTRDVPERGARIALTYEGAVIYDPPPPGHRVDRREYHLPDRAAPVELGRGHARGRWQSVVLTGDGRFAIVTSVEQREGPQRGDGTQGQGSLRHAVDRVDLASGEVRSLAEGRGTARTVIAPDDAVYVQGGDEVRRWPRADAPEPEAVTEGLRLAPPLDAIECWICG
jgi:hypothetical protein